MTANSTCKQDIVEIVLSYFCLRDLMSAMTEITIPVTANTNEITEMQFINVLYDLVVFSKFGCKVSKKNPHVQIYVDFFGGLNR